MHIIIDVRPLSSPSKTGIWHYGTSLICALTQNTNHSFTLWSNGVASPAPLPPETRAPHVRRVHTTIPNKILTTAIALGYPTVDTLIEHATGQHVDALLMINIGSMRVSSACPLYGIVHDITPLITPEFFSLKSRLWHRTTNIPHLLQSMRHIFAVSHYTQHDIAQCIPSIPPCSVAPAGAPTTPPLPLERFTHSPYLYYVGGIEPRKNIDTAIAGFELYKKSHPTTPLMFIIAGAPAWKYDHVMRAIAHSPYNHAIIVCGSVTETQKFHALRDAEALLFPSYYEGFGLPVLEAMTMGCPVITGPTAPSELHGGAGLTVRPHSAHDIAAAIGEIIDTPSTHAYLAQQGRERARAYSWKKTANHIISTMSDYAHSY